jgi:hypothetical protein
MYIERTYFIWTIWFVTSRRYIQHPYFILQISFVTSGRNIQLSYFIWQNIAGHFPPLYTASLFYPTKCRLSLPSAIFSVWILFGQYRLSLPADTQRPYFIRQNNACHFPQLFTASWFYLANIVCHFPPLFPARITYQLRMLSEKDKGVDRKWQVIIVRASKEYVLAKL